jgi:acetolactate synthase-1/2/3 large subunit
VDYGSFFGPSTKGMAKRVERIDEPERIPEYVARAFATAMNGRPGPVVLVLPEDMLTRRQGTRQFGPCSRVSRP